MGVEIPQDRGQVDNQKLCPVGVPGASQTDPALPLHHQSAGALDKGGEAADKDGGDLLQSWGVGEAFVPFILGVVPDGEKASEEIGRIRGIADGKRPCHRNTLNGTLPE